MRQLAAFMLILAALALASCGGGEDAKLLPGTTAQEITENLDTVKQLANEGECIGAANAAQEVSAEVEALSEVDAKLKQALQRGAAKLNEVVATCEESSTEAVAPASEAPTTEEEEIPPPGQEKKAEKEREKEEKELEKEAERQEKERQEKEVPPATPTTPTETTPAEPPVTPPSEGGGTDAPGGVSPGAPVGEGE